MSTVKSDIEIARSAKMQPINNVLHKLNVPDEPEAFMPMGRFIAKINLMCVVKCSYVSVQYWRCFSSY